MKAKQPVLPSPDRSSTVPPEVVAEIERAFREFRAAAVRLSERIADLQGLEPDTGEAARRDLPQVRAIFGKWSSDVLVTLHAAPSLGFEELRRALPGISARVLSLKLKGLEQGGLVRREILHTRPPRVRYTLTDRGWTVAWLSLPVLQFLRTSPAGEPAEAAPPPEPRP